MISVKLTEKGAVLVRAKTKTEFSALRKISYLRETSRGYVTFWTYMGDLKRDLWGQDVSWSRGIPSRLRALIQSVEDKTQGDDSLVLPFFGEMKPYPFQLEAIHAGLNLERLVIGDSVGLGKSVESLGVMFSGVARGLIRRVVLVVPKGIVHQWAEEIEKFQNPRLAPTLYSPVVLVVGTKAQRRKQHRRPWRIMIVSPGVLKRDYEEIERVAEEVDMVVLDEASCIRNHETALAEDMKSLFGGVRFRFALTATPVENSLHDLLSVIEFVQPRAFLSRKHFNQRYIVWKKTKVPARAKSGAWFEMDKKIPVGTKNLSEVRLKISPCYLRRTVKDVGGQLPRLIVLWEELSLPPRQREVYEAVKTKVGKAVEKLRGAALRAPLQALRQACNSTALVVKEPTKRPGQVKVDRLRELLTNDLSGEQAVVFTDYEKFGRLLSREFKDLGVATYMGTDNRRSRERAVDGFRCGDVRLLIGTKSLERGHNLQCAGVIVNADMPWNPAALKQRIGRVRRLGSSHEVNRVINMVCLDTVETRLIKERLYRKREIFEAVLGEDELTEADPIDSMTGKQVTRFL